MLKTCVQQNPLDNSFYLIDKKNYIIKMINLKVQTNVLRTLSIHKFIEIELKTNYK